LHRHRKLKIPGQAIVNKRVLILPGTSFLLVLGEDDLKIIFFVLTG
jgi:hypothetical protein